MPLPDADKKSPRVYTLLQNQDLENVTADTLADVADPIAIEEQNEDELRRICLVAFARMVTKGSFDGWLTAASGGEDAPIFAPFSQANTSGEDSFIPVCPIATAYTSSFTLDSNYYTPSHYPFYSGDYIEIDEYMIDFASPAGDASSTGSLAIYTLSTSDDAGWAVGRPMEMVENSEVSYATDTAGRVEVSPGATVTLEAKTWYTVAIVADDAYSTFPTIKRAKEINTYWGDVNWGGLKAGGETNYTLPASYTTSTTWTAAQTLYYIPKLWWRGAN